MGRGANRELHFLARLYGVGLYYQDYQGKRVEVRKEAVEEVLRALGVDPKQPIANVASAVQKELWTQSVRPVQVFTENEELFQVRLSVPAAALNLTWTVELESGEIVSGKIAIPSLRVFRRKTLDAVEYLRVDLKLPVVLPLGYHQLRVDIDGQAAQARLIVAPEQCFFPEALADNRRSWGLSAQLYSLVSHNNWGIGDFGDLRRLWEIVRSRGGATLGLNPLHALPIFNPTQRSPYSPTSRIWLDARYIDVCAVENFASCKQAIELVNSAQFEAELNELRALAFVDYQRTLALKIQVLQILFNDFISGAASAESQEAFEKFKEHGAKALELYATYEALGASLKEADPTLWGYPVWPEKYRDHESAAVRRFAYEHEQEIEFYKYIQWLADLQLKAVANTCDEDSEAIGLYLDLAVNADRAGADVWMAQECYATGLDVGAPPDGYNVQGQNWGFCPLTPQALTHTGYEPFIQVLRANMRYAGALRIDHAMALMRLYVIPHGWSPVDGLYLRYNIKELFAVVALESQRNRCLVIGEDMGTVPDRFRAEMDRWKMFSYRILYFMKTYAGDFAFPRDFPEFSLATSTTHDLPTLWGFWKGHDLDVKDELALYAEPWQREAFRGERAQDRKKLIERMCQEGLLGQREPGVELDDELFYALYSLMARAHSRLFVVPVEDVAAQLEQVNVPATMDQYPNWKRRLKLSIEQLAESGRFEHLARICKAEGR